MPANRSDAARRAESIPNTRRAPHLGLPAQNRRTIPAPDGLSKVGRSATARRDPHRTAAAAGSSDGLTVPRGFPLGDPDYRAAPGQPGYLDIDGSDDLALVPTEESGRSTPPARVAEGRVLQRVGTGRAPFRSAVLGGTLLVAVLGAGAAAWAVSAMGAESDQGVVNQVEQSGIEQPSTVVLSTPSSALAEVDAEAGGAAGADGSQPSEPVAAPAGQDPPAADGVITNSDVPPAANLGPATVSAIPPGDPGFGWPSTAFGLPPEPAADQPTN